VLQYGYLFRLSLPGNGGSTLVFDAFTFVATLTLVKGPAIMLTQLLSGAALVTPSLRGVRAVLDAPQRDHP